MAGAQYLTKQTIRTMVSITFLGKAGDQIMSKKRRPKHPPPKPPAGYGGYGGYGEYRGLTTKSGTRKKKERPQQERRPGAAENLARAKQQSERQIAAANAALAAGRSPVDAIHHSPRQ